MHDCLTHAKLRSLDVSDALKMRDWKTQDGKVTDRMRKFLKTFAVSKLVVVEQSLKSTWHLNDLNAGRAVNERSAKSIAMIR